MVRRRLNSLALVVVLVVVSACSVAKEIPAEKLVERKGISYEINSQTPFTGVTIETHPNGQLKRRVNYKNGLPHGRAEAYHENGMLQISTNFEGGLESGSFEVFHSNGQLAKVAQMIQGKVDGVQEDYDENGNLLMRTSLSHGKRNGLTEIFFDNNSLRYSGSFLSDEPQGNHSRYYRNGAVRNSIRFNDGVPVGEFVQMDEDGNIEIKGELDEQGNILVYERERRGLSDSIRHRSNGFAERSRNGDKGIGKFVLATPDMGMLALNEFEDQFSTWFDINEVDGWRADLDDLHSGSFYKVENGEVTTIVSLGADGSGCLKGEQFFNFTDLQDCLFLDPSDLEEIAALQQVLDAD